MDYFSVILSAVKDLRLLCTQILRCAQDHKRFVRIPTTPRPQTAPFSGFRPPRTRSGSLARFPAPLFKKQLHRRNSREAATATSSSSRNSRSVAGSILSFARIPVTLSRHYAAPQEFR
jgi:hypothetical protein